jgi:hypothetical protein
VRLQCSDRDRNPVIETAPSDVDISISICDYASGVVVVPAYGETRSVDECSELKPPIQSSKAGEDGVVVRNGDPYLNYLQIGVSLSRRYSAGGCGAKRARRKQRTPFGSRKALPETLIEPFANPRLLPNFSGSSSRHERPTRPISKAKALGSETRSTFCSRGPDRQLAYFPSEGDSLRTK